MTPAARALVVASCLAAACGGGSSSTGAGGDGGATVGGDGGATDRCTRSGQSLTGDVVGGFIVKLDQASTPPQTGIAGKVYAAKTPSTIGWELIEQIAGCGLYKPKVGNCAGACSPSQICDSSSTCITQPSTVDVGTITVRGLGDSEFTMKPIVGTYAAPADVVLGIPPAAEGTPVRFAAAGGTAAPFQLEACAVTPLVFTEMHTLTRGQALSLHWTPPADPASSRMHVHLDISHHAGTKGKIDCEVDDDGAFEIPADMVTKLINLGTGPMPTIDLTRVSVGRASLPSGLVELRVESPVVQSVTTP